MEKGTFGNSKAADVFAEIIDNNPKQKEICRNLSKFGRLLNSLNKVNKKDALSIAHIIYLNYRIDQNEKIDSYYNNLLHVKYSEFLKKLGDTKNWWEKLTKKNEI